MVHHRISQSEKKVTLDLQNGLVIAAEWMYHPYHFEMYQS